MGPSLGTFSAPMMCTSEKKDQTAAPAMRRITRCKILFSGILCVIVVVVDEGEGRGKARFKFERVRDATQDLQMRQLQLLRARHIM